MLHCPNCVIELIVAFKCNLTVEECPQCKGVWLNPIWSSESRDGWKHSSKEYRNSNDSNKADNDYYYYKKTFIENGSTNDLFDFEFT